VEELSREAQAVIAKYTGGAAAPALMGKYGLMSSLLGVQPWCTPTWEDYKLLAEVGAAAGADGRRAVHGWLLINSPAAAAPCACLCAPCGFASTQPGGAG
jgi:hypothetical protein